MASSLGLILANRAVVLGAIKADKSIQAGDVGKIIALVDSKIMPNVNFQRMTASAVGPAWRQAMTATPWASPSAARPSRPWRWLVFTQGSPAAAASRRR